MRRVIFRLGQHWLDVLTQGLSLGNRSRDALVQDERRSHVRQHCMAVGGSPAQMVNFLSVSHWTFEKLCACEQRPRRARASLEPLPLGRTVDKCDT